MLKTDDQFSLTIGWAGVNKTVQIQEKEEIRRDNETTYQNSEWTAPEKYKATHYMRQPKTKSSLIKNR